MLLAFQQYSAAWLVYLGSVIGLLIVTWRLFRGIPWPYFRRVIFISVLVLLATPTLSDANYWAPAWIVSFLELLFAGPEGALPIFRIIVSLWVVSIVLYTIASFIVFLRRKPSAKARKSDQGARQQQAHTKPSQARKNRKVRPQA